jgi:hypothetical protein
MGDKMQARERDFRKETELMITRFENNMSRLNDLPLKPSVKREAQRKMTESMKSSLRQMLDKAGAGGQFDELIGFVMGNVGEAVPGMPREVTDNQ